MNFWNCAPRKIPLNRPWDLLLQWSRSQYYVAARLSIVRISTVRTMSEAVRCKKQIQPNFLTQWQHVRQTHGQKSLNVCRFVYGQSMWHAINTDIKFQQMNSFSEIIHAAAKSPYNTDFICCSNINGRKIYSWDKLGLTINSAIIYCSCSVWLLIQRHVNMACVWNKVIVSRWHDFRKTAIMEHSQVNQTAQHCPLQHTGHLSQQSVHHTDLLLQSSRSQHYVAAWLSIVRISTVRTMSEAVRRKATRLCKTCPTVTTRVRLLTCMC